MIIDICYFIKFSNHFKFVLKISVHEKCIEKILILLFNKKTHSNLFKKLYHNVLPSYCHNIQNYDVEIDIIFQNITDLYCHLILYTYIYIYLYTYMYF